MGCYDHAARVRLPHPLRWPDARPKMRTVTQKYRQAPVADLTPHPRNPRQGDIGAIHESIDANGFYGAIIVQKATGYVLAGNHRLQAAAQAGAKRVPIIEIDCDDQTALRILLADNRVNDLAGYDTDALTSLLTEIAMTGNLHGTGFDGDDLDDLLKDLDHPEPDDAHTITIKLDAKSYKQFSAFAADYPTPADAVMSLIRSREPSR